MLEEKMTLPKTFDTCPICNSNKRLGAGLIQELKDENKLHKDSFNSGLMHQVPMLDQAHPPAVIALQFKIKVLLIYWDVCGECGTMYCTKFDCAEMPAQVQMQQPQPPASQRPTGPTRGNGPGLMFPKGFG